jgi:hypothetical protein
MATAILKFFQFYPIIAKQEPDFCDQGLWAGQIGEKGSWAGADFVFLGHAVALPV